MHSLTSITALGGSAARIDTVSGLTLREIPDLALANVAARAGQTAGCLDHLTALLGADAPGPGRAVTHAGQGAFWMGPEHWMITAPYDSQPDLAAVLKIRFGETASITEQTDAWVCFDLEGDGIEAVMELLCAIDMRRLRPGDAVRSVIHHLGCFVIATTADTTATDTTAAPEAAKHLQGLRVLGPRASAGSLHHALLTAMESAL